MAKKNREINIPIYECSVNHKISFFILLFLDHIFLIASYLSWNFSAPVVIL